MNKDKFLGFRADEDTLEFIAKEAREANKTMSEWIRGQIKQKRGK